MSLVHRTDSVTGEISAQSTEIKFEKQKQTDARTFYRSQLHVVALLTPLTLVTKLIRILPNKKSIQGKNKPFWALC